MTMGAAHRKPLESLPLADEVLARLPDPQRAFVRLHFVVVDCLASRASARDEASELLRACLAVRVALASAAAEGGVDAMALTRDLSTAGLRAMTEDFAQEPDQRRVAAIAHRIDRLNAQIESASRASPTPAAGPAFARFLGQSVGLDAALVLVTRARAEEIERAQLLEMVERLLADLEGSDTSDVVLPGIGPRLPPATGTPWTGLLAEDVLRAAEVAFACERVRDARDLLALGLAWYPAHPGLERFEADIAPPAVSAWPPNALDRASWLRNRAWVDAHARQYAGQWIAVADGQLFATAARPSDLPRKLPSGTLLVRARRG
jgi:hypothetical protein